MTTRFNCPDCEDSVFTLDEEAQVHTCPECKLNMTVEAADKAFEDGDLIVNAADADDNTDGLNEETEFNGFANRQTWATNLTIQNSFKLFRESRDLLDDDDEKTIAGLKAFVESNDAFTDMETDDVDYSELLDEMREANTEATAIAEELNTALVGEEELPEETRTGIVTVFESALQVAVNRIRLRIEEETAERFDTELAEAVTDLNTQANDYLTSVAEEWYNENEIAIESGIKVEKTEQFLEGLQQLFKDNFIKVPEDRFDVLADLAQSVSNLEGELAESRTETAAAKKELVQENVKGIVTGLAEGLADSDVERLDELAESIDYESDEQFTTALTKLKESLIDSKNTPAKKKDLNEVTGEVDDDDPLHLKSDDPLIAAAANMLRKR